MEITSLNLTPDSPEIVLPSKANGRINTEIQGRFQVRDNTAESKEVTWNIVVDTTRRVLVVTGQLQNVDSVRIRGLEARELVVSNGIMNIAVGNEHSKDPIIMTLNPSVSRASFSDSQSVTANLFSTEKSGEFSFEVSI